MTPLPSPPRLPALAPSARQPLVPAWGLLRRNRHVTVPMAVPPAFVAAGAALTASPQAAIPAAVGSAVLAGSVWWAAPHKWTGKDGKPRWPEVWYARASALAAGAWLSATAYAGLGVPELIAAGALGTAWGIPWFLHKRARKHEASIVAEWEFWWLHYAAAWDLAGSHITDVTRHGVIDTLHVQLRAGHQTLASVKAVLPKLESALQGHVEAGMTRCEVVKGNPSQVLIHLKRENPHDAEVGWEQSLAPSTVTGTMPIGRSEAGEWVFAPMLENWFIIGRKRSGKSNELSVALASITGCRDARPPWIIDLKGGRSARPWAQCSDWIATTIEEARLLLGAGVAEVRARARDWYTGSEQGVPTEDVPALFIVVDEAHGVLSNMSGDAECQRSAAIIASEGGAVCVYVIVMTQYGALHESVGTDQIRGNLPARMCFAVSDPDHGQFALTDWRNLDASKLENQGEFYWRRGPDQPSAPCRGPHMPHDLVRAIAGRHAKISRPRLVLFATEWQQVYDARHDRLPAVFRRSNLSPDAAPPPPVEVPMAPVSSLPPELAEILERIEDDVAAVPDLAAPPPVDPADWEAALADQERQWAAELQRAPAGIGVKPARLEAVSGMGRTRTHELLNALIGRGVITKLSYGRYAPLPGQDVEAGLRAIKEANDRLAEQARQMVSA